MQNCADNTASILDKNFKAKVAIYLKLISEERASWRVTKAPIEETFGSI